MDTKYNCPNCGNNIKILDAKAGEDYDCPTCGTTLVMGMDTPFTWDKDKENRVIELRQLKFSYPQIARELGTTATSVKHKFRRINQSNNNDRYSHPKEKVEQLGRVLPKKYLHTLELNCGWGNLTKEYQKLGEVLSFDIEQERVDLVNSLAMADVDAHKADSFLEIHRLIYNRLFFDVVDIDPYGLPSRYFPHVLKLIKDGILLVTFPKLGSTQINKITIEHYRVFWGISLKDKENYLNLIHQKVTDFGMQNLRRIKLIECIDIGSVYRIAYSVKKESALTLVGLEVNRNGTKSITNNQLEFLHESNT